MAGASRAEPLAPLRLHVRLTAAALEPDALRLLVGDPGAGATVVMVGSTRAATGAERTAALHYEAHEPLARRLLEGILAAACAAHSLAAAAVEHRLGRVAVGDGGEHRRIEGVEADVEPR